jgi:hypothetical protein
VHDCKKSKNVHELNSFALQDASLCFADKQRTWELKWVSGPLRPLCFFFDATLKISSCELGKQRLPMPYLPDFTDNSIILAPFGIQTISQHRVAQVFSDCNREEKG